MSTVGTIHSSLTGIDYSSAGVQAGDRLSFEREPENRDDRNAIKVMKGGDRIGYLNRHDALWLASLMDDWLVELKATQVNCVLNAGAPVKLTIRTTDRGNAILSPNRSDSPKAALHNSLLTVYFNLDGYSGETLKKILLQYSTMMGDVHMLPETLLIFNIITTRLEDLENNPASAMNDEMKLLSPDRTIK